MASVQLRHHEATLDYLSVIHLPVVVVGGRGGLRPMMTAMMKPGA